MNMSASKFIAFSTLTNFVLHLIWEYIQCGPLFVHLNKSPTHLNMFIAVVGDVIIFWVAYLIAALLKDEFRWGIGIVTKLNWLGFGIVSGLISAGIEHIAVVQAMWSYKPLNPIIPGIEISIVPVIQMALLNCVTLFIVRRYGL